MKRIGIVQSSYIPWKGYFHLIHSVDVFVFLDDVQYTTRDWRNRNKIKMSNGTTCRLTVPVIGGRDQLIRDARIDHSQKWARKHLNAFRHSYGKAPFFDRYFPTIENLYAHCPDTLSELNQILTRQIAAWLGINTAFRDSDEIPTSGTKDDKLLAIIHAAGGDHYVSGPKARDYIVTDKFAAAGVELEYMDYSQYPPYVQISTPFEHHVSVLDMLFMLGPEAPAYIWETGKRDIGH